MQFHDSDSVWRKKIHFSKVGGSLKTHKQTLRRVKGGGLEQKDKGKRQPSPPSLERTFLLVLPQEVEGLCVVLRFVATTDSSGEDNGWVRALYEMDFR